MSDQKKVKVQKLPTIGRPLSLKGSRWKSRLTVNQEDLRALKATIKANEKARKGE